MIKNIILDIGGVITDYSNAVTERYLGKTKEEIKELNKIVYGSKYFKQALLGNMSQTECMNLLVKEYLNYKIEIEKLLLPRYQENILPLKTETLKLIYELKEKNYKIYFLSNLTQASYEYVKNILDSFEGGIYSFKEHMLKPHKEIYELLLKRYNLNTKETIFFDDTLRNIETGNRLGIKSIQFKSIDDIINNI